MLPHYLWNVKVQILRQITDPMFDETKYIFSYGSADSVVVKFTTAARNVLPCPYTRSDDAYSTRLLHR